MLGGIARDLLDQAVGVRRGAKGEGHTCRETKDEHRSCAVVFTVAALQVLPPPLKGLIAAKKPPPKQGSLTFSADGFVWLELILQWNVHFRNTIGSGQIFRKHRCAAILQNSILEKIHRVAVNKSDVSLADDL